jgi:predicted GIY-YIG superfamily endonuclease
MTFLENNWCGLNWTPWVSFNDISQVIPIEPGVYRVKPVNQQTLIYIGQTGNVRTRTTTLRRESNRDTMPFSDPHRGAPCLWAWKDAEGLQFECSSAPCDVSNIERRAIEHLLFWQYRVEYGESPLCAFGRFHENYKISSQRSKQIHGCRLPIGQLNPAGGHSQTPLTLKGYYNDQDWMGMEWSEIKPFCKQEIKTMNNNPGVYKIFTDCELLYIGETMKIKNRLSNHIKKDWTFPTVYFSVAMQANNIEHYQLKELENDLIAGYYKQAKIAPVFQFRNLQPA